MGFDFSVIEPLLPSHCGFSFVFGCGVSFLVSSSFFLLMIVQQLVVILVFSQAGVRARPSTLPSWFLIPLFFFNNSFYFILFWPRRAACKILVPRPGIEPTPPAVEVWIFNHWTAGGVPKICSFVCNIYVCFFFFFLILFIWLHQLLVEL